jgi:lipopolysaccharide/colanic/teichoic acid biosynthesis glycosyltransferase
MNFTQLIDNIWKLREFRAEVGSAGFHSARQFGAVLDRWRVFADRSGSELALIVFSTDVREMERSTLIHLTKILKKHLRLSDEAGRLDRHRLGVVLPNTSTDGAWTLAERVCSEFPPHVPRPDCRVYKYPSDWLSADEDRIEDEAKRPVAERPAQSLEPLLKKPLPLWKRCVDLIGAAAGLILLAPLFAIVAVAIKATSPGPVFFRQWRFGRGGRKFQVIKFRSMVVDAESRKQELMDRNEQDGPAFKIKSDPRVTPVGRFLRATSIDELPQLWNVLTGDMSLVGPRPMVCSEVAACRTWQRRRLDVTPGLTCVWQVEGRSQVPFDDWMRMDLRYIRTRSLWQDLKLVLQTVPAVALGKGC